MGAPDVQDEARRQELRSLLRQGRAEPAPGDSERIVDAARARVEKLVDGSDTPLPRERLAQVRGLADLIADKDWPTPPSVAPRVLLALLHFVEGVDGANGAPLENAAELTRLVAEDLRDELAGHREFQEQREKLRRRRFADARDRERALVQRRRGIRARIQGRRWRREGRANGS